LIYFQHGTNRKSSGAGNPASYNTAKKQAYYLEPSGTPAENIPKNLLHFPNDPLLLNRYYDHRGKPWTLFLKQAAGENDPKLLSSTTFQGVVENED
jgi:hypothetical protein